ncbi:MULTISPECIES: SAM-dependent methyltransferase [Gordonibacter]|uniref:Methyltransferase domain-containing protein n=1 Tax=Gordonibacter faecis TaxID=3047475 RepID=A0ABT7DIB6_9ACTN|nr:class I SAM-dependent methyltransferase [Gordonibacter sp. KGMB12511]MDJ1649268.1 methyltransferase domain-containing protein [Gordonibacter sp. KGMB12511]HIW75265.1 methyltransferase domain-containing protein [Candidatus Gordonibacter avicola]
MISCDTLLSLLEPPALYEFTDEPFWDDEHISAQMLAAHLDPNFEGASRNHTFIDRSVAWIARVAPVAEYQRLVDLGCGPGLYAERLARAGYRVTGVDFSRRSIAHARDAAEQQGLAIDYCCENYLALDLGQQFDVAIMIYCDYGALSAADRRTLLDRARAHLRPGGLLVLDVFSRRAFDAFEEGRIWEDHPHGGFWRPGPYLEMQHRLKYEDVATLEQIVVADCDGASAYHLWNTYFTPEMLSAELAAAGFDTLVFAGDVAGASASSDSQTLAVVAQAHNQA